ncbi:phage holin family protein [Nocardioides sp. B-3]|uniref:phage holin family protein n=1 Tax=Nocardioides sp. B-3 TaxID=2895565 RepID=UPI00215354F4|nr:phage holin family protein [Nocardioides sp. B-3]
MFAVYLLIAGILAFIGVKQVKQVKGPERDGAGPGDSRSPEGPQLTCTAISRRSSRCRPRPRR